MKFFIKLLFLLNSHERKQLILLFFMITIMALLDMISVASILPLVAVLTNSSFIETNFILNTMFQNSSIFRFENKQQFLFALGILTFSLLIISLIFKALTTYMQLRFVKMCEHNIGKRLVEGYLHQPYEWFLNHHSVDLGKNILSEVSYITEGVIRSLLEIISKSLVAFTLIFLIIIVDPKLTLIICCLLGLIYSLFFYFIRHYLNQIGEERLKNNQLRFRVVSEAFDAIKEVKLRGLEKNFTKIFSIPSQSYSQNQASSQIISQLPRFILEGITFFGILLIILYSIGKTGDFISSLPIISLYIFSGYRLMPALQQIYASFSQLIFVSPALDKLYSDINNLKPFNKSQVQDVLSLNESISLKNIHYSYPNSSRTVLKGINLNIPAKSTVGIIGITGSGKTTAVDIILGLLNPQKGTLEIDGKVITTQNVRCWQRSIGYVPQHICLSDDTIAANIAFGEDSKCINQLAVEKSSKIANLHNFIMSELPRQYQTIIGERGVRLSGGERQRIGIARALYHTPKVIIFDEATSSLDVQTEKIVIDAINNISSEITKIIIAHRLNTIKNCDIIFKFDKGNIINQGTYDQIVGIN